MEGFISCAIEYVDHGQMKWHELLEENLNQCMKQEAMLKLLYMSANLHNIGYSVVATAQKRLEELILLVWPFQLTHHARLQSDCAIQGPVTALWRTRSSLETLRSVTKTSHLRGAVASLATLADLYTYTKLAANWISCIPNFDLQMLGHIHLVCHSALIKRSLDLDCLEDICIGNIYSTTGF